MLCNPSISSDLLEALNEGRISGQDPTHYNLTQSILEELIQRTVPPFNVSYSGTMYVSNMLDIFQTLLADPSFSGRSLLVQTIQSFAYSLLNGELCNAPAITHSRALFYLRAAKLSHSSLSGQRFSSNNNTDFIQFPAQIIAPQVRNNGQACSYSDVIVSAVGLYECALYRILHC